MKTVVEALLAILSLTCTVESQLQNVFLNNVPGPNDRIFFANEFEQQRQMQQQQLQQQQQQQQFQQQRQQLEQSIRKQELVKDNDIIKNYTKQNDVVTQTKGQLIGEVVYTERIPSNIHFGPIDTPTENVNVNRKNVQPLNMQVQVPFYDRNANKEPSVSKFQEAFDNRKVSATVNPDPVALGNRQTGLIQITNTSLALINFSLNLFKNADAPSRNMVISPYSVATLLALLQQGALGTTQMQLAEALQMTPDASADAFKKFTDAFQSRSSRTIFNVANNIYIADAFELNPAFKSLATRTFGSEVTPMRFGRSEEAVRVINQWVSSRTNNKIPELLTSDAVGDNTQMVLVNAVYFKGLWQVRFKPDSTLPRDFNLGNGEQKTVPFMRMRRVFKTGVDQNNGAQVLVLPFENEQYSLMLILPSKLSSVKAMLSSMTPVHLAHYHKFTPKEIDVEIPKFTVRADTELTQPLKKMGITKIFSHQSELIGVGMYRTYAPQVSSSVHTAMLAVDEDGGTAAAATSFAVVALSYDEPSVVFKANRPFLAVLWDNQFAIPLFMAKIEDPVL